jgi:hypothetical protein
MNPYTRSVFGLLLIVVAFSACKPKLLFSEEERMKLAEREVPITSVQFYNDKEIILRRKMNSSDLSVSGGVIKTVDGRQVEEIKIPRYTPCIADSFVDGRFFVRFEREDDRQMRFYKNSYNMFQIDAERWIAGKGKVEYAGKVFFIENAGNDALLVVRKSKLYDQSTNRNFAKGVLITDKKGKGKTEEQPVEEQPEEQPDNNLPYDEEYEEGGSEEGTEENPDGDQ